MAFYLLQDGESPYAAIYVRTEENARGTIDDVALVLRSLSPQVLNARVQAMEDLLEPQVRAWRIGAVLFSLFGALATSLAAIGLYAVLALDVARRAQELGVRAALGADARRLVGDVLRRGGKLTGAGLLLGLAAAYVGAPYLGDLLFRVSPRDPTVLAGVGTVVLASAVAGSLLPGLRATRVDPASSLRIE